MKKLFLLSLLSSLLFSPASVSASYTWDEYNTFVTQYPPIFVKYETPVSAVSVALSFQSMRIPADRLDNPVSVNELTTYTLDGYKYSRMGHYLSSSTMTLLVAGQEVKTFDAAEYKLTDTNAIIGIVNGTDQRLFLNDVSNGRFYLIQVIVNGTSGPIKHGTDINDSSLTVNGNYYKVLVHVEQVDHTLILGNMSRSQRQEALSNAGVLTFLGY